MLIEERLRERADGHVVPLSLTEVHRRRRARRGRWAAGAVVLVAVVSGGIVALGGGGSSVQQVDTGFATQATSGERDEPDHGVESAEPASNGSGPQPLVPLPMPFDASPIESLTDGDLIEGRAPFFPSRDEGLRGLDAAQAALAFMEAQFPDQSFDVRVAETGPDGEAVVFRWRTSDDVEGSLLLRRSDRMWVVFGMGSDDVHVDVHQISRGARGFAVATEPAVLTLRAAVVPDDWPGSYGDPDEVLLTRVVTPGLPVYFEIDSSAQDLRFEATDLDGDLLGLGIVSSEQVDLLFESSPYATYVVVAGHEHRGALASFLSTNGPRVADWVLHDRWQSIDTASALEARGIETGVTLPPSGSPADFVIALVAAELGHASAIRTELASMASVVDNMPVATEVVSDHELDAPSGRVVPLVVTDAVPVAATCSLLGVSSPGRSSGDVQRPPRSSADEAVAEALGDRGRRYLGTTTRVDFVNAREELVGVGGVFPDRPNTFAYVVSVVEISPDAWVATRWSHMGC